MVRFNAGGHTAQASRFSSVSIPQWFDSTAHGVSCASSCRTGFNPTMVRFNAASGLRLASGQTKFQSHNGSIQRMNEDEKPADYKKVSIPQWFDSTLSLVKRGQE